MLTYQYVTTLKEYTNAIAILKKEAVMAGDSETYALPEYRSKGSALDPHTGRIAIFALKGRTTLTYLFDFIWLNHYNVDWKPFIDLLNTREWIVMQNAKFDLKFLQSTLGFMPQRVRCTMIMAKLLTNATGSKAGRARGHSLKDLARDLLDVQMTGKGEEQTSVWNIGINSRNLDNEWWVNKLNYVSTDVEYLFPIHDILYDALTFPLPHSPFTKTKNNGRWGFGMTEVLEREFKYTVTLAEREYIGLCVSEPMMKALQDAVAERLNELAVELSIIFELDKPKPDFEHVLRASHRATTILNSPEGLKGCIQKSLKFNNLTSVQGEVLKRMLEILQTLSEIDKELEKNGEEAARQVFIDEDEEQLFSELKDIESSYLVESCELMQKVLEYKRMQKQNGMDLRKFINVVTGRIHPFFSQLGAATGRLACSSPNLQQVSNRFPILIIIPDKDLFRTKSKNVTL